MSIYLAGTNKSQFKMASLDQSHFRHYFQFDKSTLLCVSNLLIETCSLDTTLLQYSFGNILAIKPKSFLVESPDKGGYVGKK